MQYFSCFDLIRVGLYIYKTVHSQVLSQVFSPELPEHHGLVLESYPESSQLAGLVRVQQFRTGTDRRGSGKPSASLLVRHNLHKSFPIVSQSPNHELILADGDVHTGGALWGPQGEQCPVSDANFCNVQRQQLTPDERPDKRERGYRGPEMNDYWDEDDNEEPTWEDVLLARERETRPDGAEALELRWRGAWPTPPTFLVKKK